VLAAAVFVSSASAADTKARLTKERAVALFLANDKVADWLDRYPVKGRLTDATYESDSTKCAAGAQSGCWTVHVWWKKNDHVDAGEIAQGKVDDASTQVTEAWTGPQVAWKMARGYAGAFGGKKINSLSVWLAFCAAFLLGLLDFRRPLSLRNLDLLALLSFSVSLWFFNHGNIFTSVPLAYPPLAYLLARCVWIGVRGKPVKAARPIWKPAILLAAAVFLMGFRIGLNVEDSNVIDVGYAGVIGAERIATGVMPYDHFPEEDNLKACGPADSSGEIRDRIQFNGRCESANPLGDTYGPVAYEAYLPGYWIRGWSGKWDNLPAVHLTSIIFDVLCALGLGLVGLRADFHELLKVPSRLAAIAGELRGAAGAVQRPEAIRFLHQRRFVFFQRLARPVHREQQIAEQFACGRERTRRHRVLLGRVFAVGSGTHLGQRLAGAPVGHRGPRRGGAALDLHLFRPVSFALAGQPRLQPLQRLDRRFRVGGIARSRRSDRAREPGHRISPCERPGIERQLRRFRPGAALERVAGRNRRQREEAGGRRRARGDLLRIEARRDLR